MYLLKLKDMYKSLILGSLIIFNNSFVRIFTFQVLKREEEKNVLISKQEYPSSGFPSGSVVKNLPAMPDT